MKKTIYYTLVRADGVWLSSSVELSFVQGEKFFEFLNRQGNISLRNPQNGEEVLLRELATLSKIDLDTTINVLDDVISPLQEVQWGLPELRQTLVDMKRLLKKNCLKKLERQYAGSPAYTGKLLVNDILGISSRSNLGSRIKDLTIAEIGVMNKDQFLEVALVNIPSNKLTANKDRAIKLYDAALELYNLGLKWI